MRRYVPESEQLEGSQPTSARRDAAEEAAALRALAAGRVDALNPRRVLHLQRLAGNGGVGGLLEGEEEQRSPVHDVLASGGGQELDSETRADMEARLGHDFGDVRVHTDTQASDSAKAVQAHAYTVGNNIVFQRDAYAPDSEAGRRTLAHELTHVIQQRSGPVDGTPAPGGIRVSDPSDRFEQEASATADRALFSPAPAAAPAGAGLAVQRQAEVPEEEEETPVQALSVQREEVDEEEEMPG